MLKMMYALRLFLVQRRKLKLKAKFESGPSHSSFNTLISRRFQHGFDRFRLHRLTLGAFLSILRHFLAGGAARMVI
jgi:hypothetical protein